VACTTLAISSDTDRLITQNELAAMNRYAPFPDLDAACSIRPPAVRHARAAQLRRALYASDQRATLTERPVSGVITIQ